MSDILPFFLYKLRVEQLHFELSANKRESGIGRSYIACIEVARWCTSPASLAVFQCPRTVETFVHVGGLKLAVDVGQIYA